MHLLKKNMEPVTRSTLSIDFLIFINVLDTAYNWRNWNYTVGGKAVFFHYCCSLFKYLVFNDGRICKIESLSCHISVHFIASNFSYILCYITSAFFIWYTTFRYILPQKKIMEHVLVLPCEH
jgi:hypothetical protein